MLIQEIHNGFDDSGKIPCLVTAPIGAFAIDAKAYTLGVTVAKLGLGDAVLDIRGCAHVHLPSEGFHRLLQYKALSGDRALYLFWFLEILSVFLKEFLNKIFFCFIV